MLDLFAKHGLFDLTIKCKGDVHIDDHHTVEDIAICLGRAFTAALGNKMASRVLARLTCRWMKLLLAQR
jgi:imidazoleglycerol-phosphate dehydratase